MALGEEEKRPEVALSLPFPRRERTEVSWRLAAGGGAGIDQRPGPKCRRRRSATHICEFQFQWDNQ